MSQRRHITGSCHCGNVTFDLDLPVTASPIPVRACSCTFCRKHGGVYTSHPDARLAARVADGDEVTRYQFGHRTAVFYVCRRCGAVPFVVSRVDGRERAVVNVNTFENVTREELDASVTDFEGESVPDRLARRGQNWIGDVSIEVGGR